MAKKILKNKLKGALYVGALTFDAGETKVLDEASLQKDFVEAAVANDYLSVSEPRIESDEVQGEAPAPAEPSAPAEAPHGEDNPG